MDQLWMTDATMIMLFVIITRFPKKEKKLIPDSIPAEQALKHAPDT